MKPEGINYEIVKGIIDEMITAGEKITIRNIRARSGGKNSTVAEFKKRWGKEQKIEITDDSLSDDVKRAIIADRNAITTKIKESYEEQLKNIQALADQEHELLKEEENKSNNLAKELEEAKLKLNAETTQLTIQIKSLEKYNEEIKKQLEATQKKLDTITEEKHSAIKDAAVWESKYTELKELLGNKK